MTLSHISIYAPWFKLKAVPGLGNILFKRLIDRFGSAEGVLAASYHDLKTVKGMGNRVVERILQQNRRHTPAEIHDEIKRIVSKGFKLVTLADSDYPSLLKQIPDPPPFFSYIGTLVPQTATIAIVGSRQATTYGLNTAQSLGHDLAKSGFQVISGMALGIDTAAHEGALKAQGQTLAVLGSGLANIYPRENRRLFHAIADNGAVISEFPIYAKPEARHFPMRNRIISGISTGTIVVEAAARSGSLITARLAAEYGREVFAVPGNIHSSNSTGTHALLKQGAKLVENQEDVMEELQHLVHKEALSASFLEMPKNDNTPPHVDASQQSPHIQIHSHAKSTMQHPDKPVNIDHVKQKTTGMVNTEISFDKTSCQYALLILLNDEVSPLHIDTLIEQCPFDTAEVTAALLDLELSGLVLQQPGKLFLSTHVVPLHRKQITPAPLSTNDRTSRRTEE